MTRLAGQTRAVEHEMEALAGIDAPICQGKRLGCLRDVSAHAEVCHNTLVDFTGEEAFEAADDLASGPAASRPAGDVVDRRLVGIVKLRPTAVLDAQHGGFTAGSSPVSWGSIDELFVNLTIPFWGRPFTLTHKRGMYCQRCDAGLRLAWRPRKSRLTGLPVALSGSSA